MSIYEQDTVHICFITSSRRCLPFSYVADCCPFEVTSWCFFFTSWSLDWSCCGWFSSAANTANESFTAWYMIFLICSLSSWLVWVSDSSRNSWVKWKQCDTFSGDTKSSATFMQSCKFRTYKCNIRINVTILRHKN